MLPFNGSSATGRHMKHFRPQPEYTNEIEICHNKKRTTLTLYFTFKHVCVWWWLILNSMFNCFLSQKDPLSFSDNDNKRRNESSLFCFDLKWGIFFFSNTEHQLAYRPSRSMWIAILELMAIETKWTIINTRHGTKLDFVKFILWSIEWQPHTRWLITSRHYLNNNNLR